MTFWKWSKTAATNGSADSTCPFPEGMSPAALNDGNRGMMAAAAKYRDDIAGAIVTGGTSTAYTVTSYQVFDTIAHLNGQMIAFVPHTTNAGACTLNVDGVGPAPIRQFRNVDLTSGVLIQNTPYLVVYNSSAGEFNLHNSFGNPYNIPIGASIDYWGATAPNSSFVLAYGQAISRTTYSALFSLFGTAYGPGDGSTTFNIPDLRGRVVAGSDVMGGSPAGRLTDAAAGFGDVLGEAGGSQTRQLVTSNLPPYTPSGTISGTASSNETNIQKTTSTLTPSGGGSATVPQYNPAAVTINGNQFTFSGTAQGGNSSAFGIVQPTIVANKLLRVI